VPVVSCATIGEVTTFDAKYCWRIFRDPILFQKTIQKMEIMQDYFYIDLGPSGTLATFAGYNLKEGSTSEIFPVMTPFGNNAEKLNKVLKTYKSSKKIKKVKTMKTEMTSYLFPGQGSQKKRMGGALFDEFDDVTEKADNILGYSIKELCLSDPKRQLSQTQYTQPALFVVNALWFLKMCEQDERAPDFVAGHSLGEYNALLAAGGIDFETGLKLVKKRGELMGKAVGGGMAAVIGLDEGSVEKLLQANDLHSIDIANYNTPSQIVISGPKQDIERAQSIFESAGGRYIPLNVSAAFHSRYMQQARDEFESFLSGFEFSELKILLISNVHAKPYNNKDIVVNLADQLRMPVRWTESIRYLLGQGDMHFEEIGHGAVLTNMVNKIQNLTVYSTKDIR
jgi:trans-AT polyketide synthase/acyltransferase/oxidoreductase domain-containing protein